MLFWLKKTLTIPILPLYFVLITGLIGVVALWSKKHARLGRVLLTVSFASLAVFSNKGVASLLLAPLEQRYTPIAEASDATTLPEELQRCEAIAVLGGGHGEAPGMSRVNQLVPAALSRLTEAVRLARLLPHTKLIVCGNHRPAPTHAQVLGEAAISLGIPAERIVYLDTPRDTEDEIAGIAEHSAGRPVAIVTSAWHMPRAMQLCDAADLQAVPCPADFMLHPGADRGWETLEFDLGALGRSTKAIREHAGSLWNSLRGK